MGLICWSKRERIFMIRVDHLRSPCPSSSSSFPRKVGARRGSNSTVILGAPRRSRDRRSLIVGKVTIVVKYDLGLLGGQAMSSGLADTTKLSFYEAILVNTRRT